MKYALTLESNPGIVLMVSDGEFPLPSQVVVDSLPEGGELGVMYYKDGVVYLNRASAPADSGIQTRGVLMMRGSGDPDDGEEEDEEEPEEELPLSLEEVGLGGHTGVNYQIRLPLSDWGLVTENGVSIYQQGFASEAIKIGANLLVNGVNRDAQTADIVWTVNDGSFTFTTEKHPIADVVIDALLISTDGEFPASGRIEARPGASWAAITYRQSLHAAEWSLQLAGHESETVRTPVNFDRARLLFSTFQGVTGALSVVCTRMELSQDGYLIYTLMNLSSEAVTITDADIRLVYAGVLSGFVASGEEDETVAEYISYRDFSEI